MTKLKKRNLTKVEKKKLDRLYSQLYSQRSKILHEIYKYKKKKSSKKKTAVKTAKKRGVRRIPTSRIKTSRRKREFSGW
jgi:hypothetical protein